MIYRRGWLALVVTMLAISGAARAADTDSTDSLEEPTTPTGATATPAASEGALMTGLDKIGVGKALENARINVFGYVEGGYLYDATETHNITGPMTAPGDLILFPGPNKGDLMLNQVDLSAERIADTSKGQFDVGFRIDAAYGRDPFFTHSNGLFDHNNHAGGGSVNQFDIFQAYVDFALPITHGLLIRAGKFDDLLGTEHIDPTSAAFLTHVYNFFYGLPVNQTGILARYTLNHEFAPNPNTTTITAGISRGWNQSLHDNNGSIDGIVQANVVSGNFSGTIGVIFGPEGVLPYGPSDNTDWWVTVDASGTLQISDPLSVTGEVLYGDASALTNWAGVAAYGRYALEKHVALNLRGEFYHDAHGITTGFGGGDLNYWELTIGAAITPLPDSPLFQSLTIRPELRGDWDNQAVFDFAHKSQYTFAIDAYWKF